MIFGVAGPELDPAPREERQRRAGSAVLAARNSLRNAKDFPCYGCLRRGRQASLDLGGPGALGPGTLGPGALGPGALGPES